MKRLVPGLLLVTALALGACGGDDDDNGAGATATTPAGGTTPTTATSGTTPTAAAAGTPTSAVAGTPTAAAGETATTGAGATPTTAVAEATPTSGGSTTGPEGAPTPEDPNFPDIYADLAAGSSAEADTGEDMQQREARVRVTITNIRDDVEPGTPIYQVQPGNKLWVADVKLESIGDGSVPIAEWALQTTDGTSYQSVYGAQPGTDLFYFELAAGDSVEGAVVFEIPEDATIAWLLVDPSIYVGNNIVFLP